MQRRHLLALFSLSFLVALLTACGGGGGGGGGSPTPTSLEELPTEVVELDEDDNAAADLWISQFFAFAEGDYVRGVSRPLPGEVIRAALVAREGFMLEGGELVSVQIHDPSGPDDTVPDDTVQVVEARAWEEAGPEGYFVPGAPIVAFVLPDDMQAGVKRVRIQVGELVTALTQIEVADPEALDTRNELSAHVQFVVDEALGDGNSIVAPYAPLPQGAEIRDGYSDETIRTVQGSDAWLYFAFESHAGFSQDHATAILVEGITSQVEILPGSGLPPEVVDPQTGALLGVDYGETGFQQNLYFNVNQGAGNPPLQLQAPAAGAGFASIAPAGLTGRRKGPCPNGYKTVGIVLQLDDKDGFDWLRGQVGSLYKDLGIPKADVHELQPEDMINKYKKYDADQLEAALTAITNGLECGCAEVIITVISHGKVGTVKVDGKSKKGHVLIFKNRVENKRGGKSKILKKTKIPTDSLLEMIARVLNEGGQDCIPVSVILHSCYSGKALETAKERIEKGSKGMNTGMGVLTSSGAGEPSYGRWKGKKGTPDIVFIDALRACMTDKSLDTDKDGTVSLDEAWDCIAKKTKAEAAKKPIKKEQNPGRLKPGA